MLFGDFLSWKTKQNTKTCLVYSHASFLGQVAMQWLATIGTESPAPLSQPGTALKVPLSNRAPHQGSPGLHWDRVTAQRLPPPTLHVLPQTFTSRVVPRALPNKCLAQTLLPRESHLPFHRKMKPELETIIWVQCFIKWKLAVFWHLRRWGSRVQDQDDDFSVAYEHITLGSLSPTSVWLGHCARPECSAFSQKLLKGGWRNFLLLEEFICLRRQYPTYLWT